MPILHHVLDDVRLSLVELHPREFFILLVLQGQVLAESVDELAMSAVVVLCPDVTFDQDVYLYCRVDGECEESFPLVVVQTVLPVDAVLGPHLPEGLKTDALLASCE